MKLFGPLYIQCMQWARHRHATYYLATLSFIESIFFPIPTDVMLAPMALAKPERAFFFAAVASVTSALGGVVGYFVGMFAFDAIVLPYLEFANKMEAYNGVVHWFETWGFWVVFIAGFSPIPYKVFTVAAGALSMSFIPFLIASLLSRSARFFLVAGLMRWGGEKMEKALHRYVEYIGWGVVVIAGIAYLMLR